MYSWLPLATIDDLAKIASQVGSEYGPEQAAEMLSGSMSSAVKGVLIEHDYVDKDYRSTYYNYYAKKGQYYRADCVRLHFFAEPVSFDAASLRLIWSVGELQDHYYGFVVLRPTGLATIGRTIVSPDVRNGACRFIISAKHKVHILGYRLAITGFPWMAQHSDISVCAHAACWAILRHYSECYSLYREYLTFDVTMMAQEFNPGGLVPSLGLHVGHVERVFQAAGTFPVHVTKTGVDDVSFRRQLLAYIDSRFPAFAAIQGDHAVAIVGYEWKEKSATPFTELRYASDELASLAVNDDNFVPYLPIGDTSVGPYHIRDIDSFIVPLPEKIHYPADAVDRLAPSLFKAADSLGVSLPKPEASIIRYLITSGSAFRQFVREHASEHSPKLLELAMNLPFAQFVWVVEIATKEAWDSNKVVARALIDATASVHDPMPLWLLHNDIQAVACDRRTLPAELYSADLGAPPTSGFTRMVQNLRTTVKRS